MLYTMEIEAANYRPVKCYYSNDNSDH